MPNKFASSQGDLGRGYDQTWSDDMLSQPCSNPIEWLYGLCCAPCFAYTQREQIRETIISEVDNILTGYGMERNNNRDEYICCLGYCWPFNKCACPEGCLCIEVCFCSWQAIMANRYAIQDRWSIENDCCDECLIWMVVCISWIRCLLELGGVDIPEEVDNLIDLFTAAVMGCMLSQQQAELDLRLSGGGTGGTKSGGGGGGGYPGQGQQQSQYNQGQQPQYNQGQQQFNQGQQYAQQQPQYNQGNQGYNQGAPQQPQYNQGGYPGNQQQQFQGQQPQYNQQQQYGQQAQYNQYGQQRFGQGS